MIASGQVARFEFQFQLGACQLETLPSDEVDRQARVFDDVWTREGAAADHALAAVIEQHGKLADAVEVLEAELHIGDVIGLAGQRRAVFEEVRRRLKPAEFRDVDEIAILNADVGFGVGVVGDGDEALAVPPFAEVVEVLVPLQLDFGTVELGRRGVGEAADDRVVVEAREDFDRVFDILVEACHAGPAVRSPIMLEAGFVIGQAAVDQAGVTGELPVRFRIVIGLQDQFAELRAGNGLGRVEAQLDAIHHFPCQRGAREEVIVVQQGGIGRAVRTPVEPERYDFLRGVFVADAKVERQGIGLRQIGLHIPRLDLQPGGKGRVRCGRVDDLIAEGADAASSLRRRIVAEIDQGIAKQVVGSECAENERIGARGADIEFPAAREASRVGIGAANRQRNPVGELIAEIETAVIEIFSQIGKGHRGAPALAAVLKVQIDFVELGRGRKVAGIYEFPFIGRFALRLRITGPQID